VALAALLVAGAVPAAAQSQAINGTIEGTVTDSSGGILPGVTVTVSNTDTGTTRVVVTNDSGAYRAPLLPLGTYTVRAELEGFKAYEQVGIGLSAGQTAVINVTLGVGALSETVSVTAEAPIVDPGKINQGRTLTEKEIKELPLTFAQPLQLRPVAAGRGRVRDAGVRRARITANGALLRVNYQIDGNDNTQKDRAGLRQMPMSEVMIARSSHHDRLRARVRPDDGLIYNAITPSGTNRVKGQGSYRFQRDAFAAKPFFLARAGKSRRRR